MLKHIKKTFGISAIMCIVGIAQTYDDVKLGEVMTTATKTNINVEDAPGNVDIVKKEDIQRRPNLKFSDTLREAGIRPSKSRGMDTFDTLTIRGISGGTNIMVDGVSLNDINNNSKMITSMSAYDLERVEVVRGPFSNIYGSGALGGAINFITAMPTELEAKAILGYGNPFQKDNAPQNLVNSYLSIGDVLFEDRLRLKASYARSSSKGYPADDTWTKTTQPNITGYIPSQDASGNPRYIVGDMGRQSYENHDARIRAEMFIGTDDSIDMGVNYSNYNYRHIDQKTYLRNSDGSLYYGNPNGSPNTSGTAGNLPYGYVGGMGNEKYNQITEFIKYRHNFKDSFMEMHLSRLDGMDIWVGPNADASPFGGSGKRVYTRHQITQLNGIYNHNLTKNYSALIGFNYKILKMDIENKNIQDWRYFGSSVASSINKSGGEANLGGIFFDVRGKIKNNLTMAIGSSFDIWSGKNYYDTNNTAGKISTTKTSFSPKLSLNYTPNYDYLQDTTMKFSLGKAFRVPTLNQLFTTHVLNDGTSVLGNTNLKPETGNSFDIGIEQGIHLGEMANNKKGIFKTYYFFTDLNSAIYRDNNTKQYENAGKTRTQGIEISLNQPLPINLGIHASYTFTHAKMIKNDITPSTIGKYLTGVPKHLANIEIYHNVGALLTSIGVEYMSKPYRNADNSDSVSGVYGATDAYLIANARFSYDINKNLTTTLDIKNIFNEKYYSYYRVAGSSFLLSLVAKL